MRRGILGFEEAEAPALGLALGCPRDLAHLARWFDGYKSCTWLGSTETCLRMDLLGRHGGKFGRTCEPSAYLLKRD